MDEFGINSGSQVKKATPPANKQTKKKKKTKQLVAAA